MTPGSPGPPHVEKGEAGSLEHNESSSKGAPRTTRPSSLNQSKSKSTSSDSVKAWQPSGDPISAQQLATRSPAN